MKSDVYRPHYLWMLNDLTYKDGKWEYLKEPVGQPASCIPEPGFWGIRGPQGTEEKRAHTSEYICITDDDYELELDKVYLGCEKDDRITIFENNEQKDYIGDFQKKWNYFKKNG